ncbi:NB-ARC domain-containing protein [Nocardia sp. NPDC127526]|uniref:NB-ARC domain-containing protein n=1 Tax=Nocardia sp. NPDC127526 TaxID=3345393 RepID=UPI00362DFAFF
MRRRRTGESWRIRLGWILFGTAMAMLLVALPVWAVATGDVNKVAGWANILALPVSALGLVLLVAETRSVRTGQPERRRPWMAPPLDRMIERPELGERLLTALTTPGVSEVGLSTGLHGAGGFGKTRLATWVCHRPEIECQYPGGLLWVTLGQEVQGADLAARINELTATLAGGDLPMLSDPDAAGAELGRQLDTGHPVLVVLDDAWEDCQLRPFRFGGRDCTRLVTTRIPDLLPPTSGRICVDAMSPAQAQQMIADGVTGLSPEMVARLANLAGRWPVLLNLVNAALRRRTDRGQPAESAAEDIAHRLTAEGPAAFDPACAEDRGRAVAATVQASLDLLTPTDRQRCLDLAIFPEDMDIPLTALRLLWTGGAVEPTCAELASLGLVSDYRLDPPGPRLVVHDVLRAHLRTRRTATEQAAAHAQLIDAVAAQLPAHEAGTPPPWWLMPADIDYAWRYLAYHLHHAGRDDLLVALLCDLRWTEAKARKFGSAVSVEADLALVNTPAIDALREALHRIGHLLGPIDPPAALGATLAGWLRGIAGLEDIVDRYRTGLPRPLLEPVAPATLRPPAAALGAVAAWAGHIGDVIGCAFSPDGTTLTTTSDDGTARLWSVADRTTTHVLRDHPGGVRGRAFSPDGALFASTGQDGTARLWNAADRSEYAVLTGHIGVVRDCAFAPDGALLATAGDDGTVRIWRTADARCHCALRFAGPVLTIAWHPDGTTLCAGGGTGVHLLTYLP